MRSRQHGYQMFIWAGAGSFHRQLSLALSLTALHCGGGQTERISPSSRSSPPALIALQGIFASTLKGIYERSGWKSQLLTTLTPSPGSLHRLPFTSHPSHFTIKSLRTLGSYVQARREAPCATSKSRAQERVSGHLTKSRLLIPAFDQLTSI